MSTQTNQTKI